MLIGNLKINGKAFLAPMAGITDRAFRELCSLFGAAVLTSEMISVKGLIYGDKKTFSLLSSPKNDLKNGLRDKNEGINNYNTPFAIQLFGCNPDDFGEAARIISELEPDIIDINMGCPAPKIVKSGAGAYLMKEPDLCGKIVEAVKKNSKIPVTVKIRSGFDENNKNAIKVAKECEFYGADAITVHGRTREQMYSGEADLEIIKNVVSSVDIPVIGNGDITSYKKAENMINYTGCKTVAIGRGALGNPWIFKNINLKKDLLYPSIEEKIKLAKFHINKIIMYKGDNIGIKEARKHLSWYVKGIKGAAALRNQIFEMKNLKDFNIICNNLLNMRDYQ